MMDENYKMRAHEKFLYLTVYWYEHSIVGIIKHFMYIWRWCNTPTPIHKDTLTLMTRLEAAWPPARAPPVPKYFSIILDAGNSKKKIKE